MKTVATAPVVLNAKTVERLTELTSLLKRVPTRNTTNSTAKPNAFDLGGWGQTKYKVPVSKSPSKITAKDLINHNCGFTACAIGYAICDPWFQNRGFTAKIEVNYDDLLFVDDFVAVTPILRDGIHNSEGWPAVVNFFGISEDVASHFFDTDRYGAVEKPKPKDVIRRIEGYLKTGKLVV